MRKIVYLFPDFFFIGAQRAAAATIRQLVRKGWDVVVIVINDYGEVRNELPEDITIVEFPKFRIFSSVPFVRIFLWPFALRKLLRKMDARYCISICPQTNFVMVLHRIFFKREYVFIAEEHQHLSAALQNDPEQYPSPWKYLYFFSLRNYYRLDGLRCVSRASSKDFIENWGIPSAMVRTIYPAIDLERIVTRSHGLISSNRKPVICSVGRLTTQKDFVLLIQAFSYVRKLCEAQLKIVGVGPEREKLANLVQELDLNDDVDLMGFVEFAEEVIATSDVFVLTSTWEGFPVTIAEAMVLNTAVVAVDCQSGPREMTRNGLTGLLVVDRTPEAVGEAILQLIKSPQERHALIENAHKYIKCFSLEATVDELESTFLSN